MKRTSYSRSIPTFVLIVLDIILFNASYFGSLLVRYDFQYGKIPESLLVQSIKFAPIFTILTVIIFAGWKLYRTILAFVGTQEVLSIIGASLTSILVQAVVFVLVPNLIRVPYGFYFIEFFALVILTVFSRFLYRVYKYFETGHAKNAGGAGERIRTMVIGAGEAGRIMVREMKTSYQLRNKVVAIIDDDPQIQGHYLEGIKVYGNRHDIIRVAEELNVDMIIFAIPTALPADRAEILNLCKETGCQLQTLPGVYQLIKGEVDLLRLRDVNLEDLLGRDPIQVNTDEILDYICSKTILVTGGGGTIGSELCRQIAGHSPKKLIIFDIYENNTYGIQLELKKNYPDLDLEVLIGSVRDKERVREIFRDQKPDLVYHAAAHKHVPLMEDSPNEAIKNNVFGTLNVAQAAVEYQTKKFVLISTDKAVNPTNVMGASKRMCEMIIQSMNGKGVTEFVAVRFGNVLGSSGSVVPIFTKQIEEGGPVTVTHPEIERFFMTIPEAVSLVLQAGYYAEGGEIFVLDMGEPVKIVDMARNLIKLSGYKPDEDIEIAFTGLRPGEKLYEEMLMSEEGLKETANKRIKIGQPITFDEEAFFKDLEELHRYVYTEPTDIRQKIGDIVPTYKEAVGGIPSK